MKQILVTLLTALALLQSAGCARRQADFVSAEVAVEALIEAAQAEGAGKLLEVLGPDSHPMIESGDVVQDKNMRGRFLRAFAEHYELQADANGALTLLVGTHKWPFPYPLVQSEGRWRFDSAAGAEEIINRRVGANELATIQSCLAFVDAQREYYARNPDNAPLLHYAQKLLSDADRKNGLYWPRVDGEAPSPLGERFARARAEGYFEGGAASGEPLRGYVYRLLTSQGPHANGGAYDYIVNDAMIGGFALVAAPAEYGVSGVKTFIVNHEAAVFSKDLGPDTAQASKAVESFDPDPSWSRETAIDPAM